MSQLVDLSGIPLPNRHDTHAGDLDRVIAVPPIRDVPNDESVEFCLSAFGNLAAGGVAFIPLQDPTQPGNPVFSFKVNDLFRGRIDSILAFCPDMVAAAAPYLFWSLSLNMQLSNAWGVVPIFPRAGTASLSFPASVDVAPGTILTLAGENTDAANTHFLAIYLYGWFWPKDFSEG